MASIPAEFETTAKSFEPRVMGPTVEVMSQGEDCEHPGAEVLKAEVDAFTICPVVTQPLSGETVTRSTCRCT